MLIFQIVFLICYVTYTQAFSCEWDCPLNAVCTGQDICTCVTGYEAIISEEDGLPHCELRNKTTNKGEFELADYRYIPDIWEFFNEDSTIEITDESETTSTTTEYEFEFHTESAYSTEITDESETTSTTKQYEFEFEDYGYTPDMWELFSTEQETETNFQEELNTEILLDEDSTESAFSTEITDESETTSRQPIQLK
ncbi:uncharacterized protein LOC119613956 isoform X2 [Lucilia sericata]|uniref:uncharacterized protein LOC119613956 isoform X2 n=1 Tax=Lucilia sericata TaxID=13632 RepID=UPI0018A82B57|nr:uncharacterized protein LOC119613956 isoform X2 [Lucilia sericata]